jgi:hypothetical protein
MKNAIKGRLLSALLLVVCSLVANTGWAQGDTGVGDKDGWVPVKHLTFTDDEIQGGVFTPYGERIEMVLRATHPSLIELREGFEAEVVKTMEDM